MKVQEIRNMVSGRLQAAGIEAYDYETWVFLEWKLGISRMDYYMDPMREIKERDMADLEEALQEREKRIPLQYLMGHTDFMGYDFYVDHRVLIPRQDTECLVEEAVKFVKDRQLLYAYQHRMAENRAGQEAEKESIDQDAEKQEAGRGIEKPAASQETAEAVRVLDLCSGSGCIGISIKLLCPDARVSLADLSEGAVEVAGQNADKLQADVRILQGDLFEALQQLPESERRFDLIVSNPPYIPTKVVEGLMPEVRDHEPHLALDGTEDGLAFYRQISRQAADYLLPGGGLYYEIGAEQGESVSGLLRQYGFHDISLQKDLAGLDRIVKGIL